MRTFTGRGMRLVLPDPVPLGFTWPELAAARVELLDLAERQGQALGELGALEEGRHVAEQRDDRARRVAARKGEKPPATTALKAHDEKLDLARRQAEALAGAIEDAEADALAVLAEHGERFAADAEAALTKSGRKVHRAIDALDAALAELGDVRALRPFLADPQRAYRPGEARPLPSLRRVNGDPYLVMDAVAALRALADALVEPPKADPPAALRVVPGRAGTGMSPAV